MKLLEHFHQLSIYPKNAKELKGLILQLAVEGKLTIDWRTENPTSVNEVDLRSLIKEEKRKLLLKNGVAKKKDDKVLPINRDELSFSLPSNWIWIRFEEIAYLVRGGSPRPIKNYITNDPNGVNWIKIGDTKGVNKYIEKCRQKIKIEGVKKSRLVQPGDFILSNSMSFGKPYIMNTTGCIHDGWLLIRELEKVVSKDFLYHILTSPYVYMSFKNSASGAVVKNLNLSKVKETLIPLPSLEEQEAIVRRVEILLQEVAQLEQLTQQRLQLKEKYVTAALNQVCEENTVKAWTDLKGQFSTFFNEEGNIKKLRETILQLAVQGKLTANWRAANPVVESASDLLKRIRVNKLELIKTKKIKKEKPLPAIEADEVPYVLPEGWVWCRMGEIAQKLGAGSTPKGGKSAYVSEGIMFFRSQNVRNYGLKIMDVALITEETHEKMKGTKVRPKDILLNITGGSIGRSTVVPDDFSTANVSQHVAIVRLMELEMRNYMHSLILSPQFQKTIMDVQVGVSREGLSMTKLKLFLIPLPPLSEVKAIVEKVNELMSFCDNLEKEVIKSKETAGALMQVVLKEVFDGKVLEEV